MTATIDFAGKYASLTLFIVGGLLGAGAVLTGLGELSIGWSIYGIGYVLALAAVAALAGLTRHSLGRIGWAGLAAVATGVILGLPELLMVWGLYAGSAAIHDLFMPYAALPFVAVGGVIAWTGVLLFGVAMALGKLRPKGAAYLLIVAALLALPFELRTAPQILWILALVLVFLALTWIGIAIRRRGSPSAGFNPSETRGFSVTGPNAA